MDAAMSTLLSSCFGRHSRAITGRHTGRARKGSSMTRPMTTKQVPQPTGVGPVAAPSCCQAAPKTFFPRRLNSGRRRGRGRGTKRASTRRR
jgi:hypothetical protein